MDWGADGQIESRFISALIYLNSPEAGGGTNFPLAKMPDGTRGVRGLGRRPLALAVFPHNLCHCTTIPLACHTCRVLPV